MNTRAGQVTLYGMMVLWCCSLLLILQLNMMINSLTNIKNRIQVYLCYRHQHYQQNNYIKKMSSLNRGIEILNLLLLIPPLSAEAQEGKDALIYIQMAVHLAYLKKMFTNPRCEWWQKIYYAKHLPYRTKNLIFLERNVEQLLILRSRKWENIIKGKENFGIKVKYTLDDIFQTSTEDEFTELSLLGLVL